MCVAGTQLSSEVKMLIFRAIKVWLDVCGVGVRFCVGFGVYAGQSSTLAFCPLEKLADK